LLIYASSGGDIKTFRLFLLSGHPAQKSENILQKSEASGILSDHSYTTHFYTPSKKTSNDPKKVSAMPSEASEKMQGLSEGSGRGQLVELTLNFRSVPYMTL